MFQCFAGTNQFLDYGIEARVWPLVDDAIMLACGILQSELRVTHAVL